MATPELPRRIERFAFDGKKVDEGVITLEDAQARKKLSHSQLKEDEWILKLVQWANRREARQVGVFCGKKLTVIDVDCEIGESVEALFLESDSLDSLKSSLGAALRWVRSQERWLVARYAGKKTLGSKGEAVCRRRFPYTQGLRVVVSESRTGFFELTKHLKSRKKTLRRRCWPSKIPVLLNGKRCEPSYDEQTNIVLRAELPLLQERPTLNIPPPPADRLRTVDTQGAWDFRRQKHWYRSEELFFAQYSGPVGAQVVMDFSDPKDASTRLQVCFCHDGVLLEDRDLTPLLPAQPDSIMYRIQYLCPVFQEELDLTTLGVIEGEILARTLVSSLYPRTIALAHEQCRVAGKYAIAQLGGPRGTVKTAERGMSLTSGTLVTIVVGTLAGGLGLTPLLCGAFVATIAGYLFDGLSLSARSAMKVVLSVFTPGFGTLNRARACFSPSVPVLEPVKARAILEETGWNDWPSNLRDNVGMWAVRFVQAAVALGFSKVVVTLARRKATVRFVGDEARPELALSTENFLAGLASLSRLQPRRMILNRDTNATVWTRDTVGGLETNSGGGFFVEADFFGKPDWAMARTRLEELCWLSPIPVELDGTLLRSRLLDRPRLSRRTSSNRIAWRIPVRPVLFHIPTEPGGAMLPLGFTEVDDDCRRLGEMGPRRGLLAITGGLREDSAVEWVEDGAIVEVRPLYDRSELREPGNCKLPSAFSSKDSLPRLAVRVFLPASSELRKRDFCSLGQDLAEIVGGMKGSDIEISEGVWTDHSSKGIGGLEMRLRDRMTRSKYDSAIESGLNNLPEFLRNATY